MLRKSKSIEEIYDEVKDYDLVITNDAPLATALNKLVEKPRLDYFISRPSALSVMDTNAPHLALEGEPRPIFEPHLVVQHQHSGSSALSAQCKMWSDHSIIN